MIAWLTGTLVATSALILLVFALREPVRRRFGPHVAYALWLLPASRMMLPTFLDTVEIAAAPVPSGGVIPADTPVDAGTDAPGLIGQFGGWPDVLVALWLAGAAAMLVRGLQVYHAQRRAILADGVQIARLGAIRIVRSECVAGPLALGIVDRVIALPLDFEQRFSERERCLALDHELAHHRSGDLIANAVAFVLLCLQWFNPLAWAAHAAFRFDQEAACDARVLDKADVADRSSYGNAIAKAASGRTLLFAGALDRPSTLSRRLRIMGRSIPRRTRSVGFGLVGGTVLAALPLTATRAVVYVEGAAIPAAAAAPVQPAAPSAASDAAAPLAAGSPIPALSPAAPLVPAAAPQGMRTDGDGSLVLPGGVKLDRGSTAFFGDDRVFINGKVITLDQASATERRQLRAAIAKSLESLERERARLPRELAEARRELERIRNGDFKRELLDEREDLRRDLAEVVAESAELRANGVDPEKMKAEIQKALRAAEAIDIDKEVRRALEEADPDKIVAELRRDEEQMKRMQLRLDQLDRAAAN